MLKSLKNIDNILGAIINSCVLLVKGKCKNDKFLQVNNKALKAML